MLLLLTLGVLPRYEGKVSQRTMTHLQQHHVGPRQINDTPAHYVHHEGSASPRHPQV